MDWLESTGEMVCQWKEKWVKFTYNEEVIKLQGLLPVPSTELQEISLEQALRWHRGNDIWATALLTPVSSTPATPTPDEIQSVLHQYEDVF